MNDNTRLILERIRKLPEHALTTSMRSPRGTFERSFKGALLADYAAMHGLTPAPSPNGPANYYFVATAEDGFKVSLSFTEVSTHSSSKQVLLAWEQDGEPLRVGVRLVVPGDDLGGRSILGVAGLELKSVESEMSDLRPESSAFELRGLVERPQRFDLGALSRFATEDIETLPATGHGDFLQPSRHYSGVSLFTLLEDAGMKLNPAINEDILRKVVVARSTDGYGIAIAAGEIEPRFMAGDVIVATACEGKPLAEDGRFRLVVPYDKVIGRAVKCLASIELIEA
ncbi:MAG TPA: molybdopterin-dependent oxidoreductase [Dehalococcoidia bacterium]|nr:molybdopterin-dependent oxidoreductase [Dehalococcoidia bacterium]